MPDDELSFDVTPPVAGSRHGVEGPHLEKCLCDLPWLRCSLRTSAPSEPILERLLVNDGQDALWPSLDQMKACLVAWKVCRVPSDALRLVDFFFHGKNLLVKEALQPLIGKVDEQLLKAIRREGLKAVNVKDADEGRPCDGASSIEALSDGS